MNLSNFIDEHLRNKNGKLEGQRINERWFTKNDLYSEWVFFQRNNITNAQQLFNFINNEDGLCECGEPKRFVGFNQGYKQYCEKCARSKNNAMKVISNTIDIELTELVNFVKTKSNGYSTTKIKQLSNNTLDRLIDRTKYLSKDVSISERIYHIEHNIHELPKCKLCGKPNDNFRTSKSGYFDYCKNKCSYIYNKNDRKIGLKRFFYSKYVDNFKSNNDYKIELFSLHDYINDRDLNVKFTHNKCGHTYIHNIKYQGHFKCPKCFPIRSKKQYEIYEWLNNLNVNVLFNDRQLIKPLELDILSDGFAIEYDSLMYHSYGYSDVDHLNNVTENTFAHVNKTELVEEHGKQLFRIFSNEWHNKQDIWKSIILSKLGQTTKIYARRCTISIVKNDIAKEFLERNHMQGSCNALYNIGLFYNKKLVSIMTFGKARYNRNAEYELLRYCTELNHTVVGGASKLLSYFERNYKPKSLVSYANRRWSTGDLYNKLGFEFIQNTKPNYFYFKGGDTSILLSRISFQKHKQEKLLENFDKSKSESTNMYNNGYRKIFDCGNKVYIKNY